MARASGRNAGFADVFGLVCLVVVVGLGFLVLPIVPAALGWVLGLVDKTGWLG